MRRLNSLAFCSTLTDTSCNVPIVQPISIQVKETAMPSKLMPLVCIVFTFLTAELSPSVMASSEPCSLLTVEQVSSALGVSMGTGKSISSKGLPIQPHSPTL